LYKNQPKDWKNLIQQAMNSDFSWNVSAKAYGEIYEELKRG